MQTLSGRLKDGRPHTSWWAIVDLRLLGIGMKKETPADLVKDTAPWTLGGLALVLISGPLIFSSDPNLYLHNQSFRFKITALVLAIIFNYTIHRWVALKHSSGGVAALTGLISLVLWISVVFGGITPPAPRAP